MSKNTEVTKDNTVKTDKITSWTKKEQHFCGLQPVACVWKMNERANEMDALAREAGHYFYYKSLKITSCH